MQHHSITNNIHCSGTFFYRIIFSVCIVLCYVCIHGGSQNMSMSIEGEFSGSREKRAQCERRDQINKGSWRLYRVPVRSKRVRFR